MILIEMKIKEYITKKRFSTKESFLKTKYGGLTYYFFQKVKSKKRCVVYLYLFTFEN